MYYLFSSNARERYVQDVLDVLALPRSARYQFRYDESIVEEALLEKLKRSALSYSGRGPEALVVLVIQRGEEPLHTGRVHFFPLRRAHIRSIRLEGRVVCARFELDSYVDWEPLKDLNDHERDRLIADVLESDQRPPDKYLSESQETLPEALQFAKGSRSTHAWQHAVIALNGIPLFENTVFYRVSSLYELRETRRSKVSRALRRQAVPSYDRRENPPLTNVLPQLSGYELGSGTANVLYLDFYHVEDPEARFGGKGLLPAAIVPTYDESYFAYSPKPIPLTFRYDNYPVPLMVSSLTQDAVTELHIKLGRLGDPDDHASELSPPLRAPEVCLVLKLTYPRRATVFQFGLLFLAQLGIVLAGKLGEIAGAAGAPAQLVSAAKFADPILGVIAPLASALLLFVLFRRMPMGTK